MEFIEMLQSNPGPGTLMALIMATAIVLPLLVLTQIAVHRLFPEFSTLYRVASVTATIIMVPQFVF